MVYVYSRKQKPEKKSIKKVEQMLSFLFLLMLQVTIQNLNYKQKVIFLFLSVRGVSDSNRRDESFWDSNAK